MGGRSGSAQAAGDYADTGWLASQDPLQMGADGDYSAHAWYRTTIILRPPGPIHSTSRTRGIGSRVFRERRACLQQ